MSSKSRQDWQSVYEVGIPASSQQTLRLGYITTQCFNVSFEHWQTYIRQLGQDNLRVVCQEQKVLGGLGIYPMGQWFGGQMVPMHGIAGVGIAPEHRGAGAASALLLHTLKSMQQQGIPLATLYASTSQLYRQVGFEQAGTYCQYQIPAQSLVVGNRNLPAIASETGQIEVLTRLYQQRAQQTNGNLERHPAIWEQMLETEIPIYTYLFGSKKQPQGYAMFTHQPAPGRYDIDVLDLVLLTSAANQRFWTFLADHRSLARNIRWYGAPIDASQIFLAEQTYQVRTSERWLLRIVDVPKALTLRGYPLALETELHLQVEDTQLPTNSGNFVLQVANGRGQVRSGGRGDLRLGIRGLSPLYTSMLTAQELMTLGDVEASTEVLALATMIFSGPQPWLSDHF